MAVKPSSSPPRTGTRPAREGGGSRAAAILLSGVGVLVIAACAVFLSYNGIYQVAVQGRVEPPYAHLYPAVFTLLLLLAFWASFVLRAAPRVHRLQVDGLILLLILIAAGASALRASDQRLMDVVALVVVAAAPWIALLFAFLLFVRVWRHLHGELPERRRAPRPAPRPEARTAPLPAGTAVRAEERGADPAEPAPAAEEPAPEGPEEKAATLLWPRAGARPLRAEDDEPDTDPMPAVRVLHPAEAPPSPREEPPASAAEPEEDRREDAGARAESAGAEPRAEEAAEEPAPAGAAAEPVAGTAAETGPAAVPEPGREPLEQPLDQEDRGLAGQVEEQEEREEEGAVPAAAPLPGDDPDEGPDGGPAAAPAGPSVITAPTVPIRPPAAGEPEQAASPDEERAPLPRRDPEPGESAIRRAAESLGAPAVPAGGDGRPAGDAAEDGFVELVAEDDPTSDEAAAGGWEPAEPAGPAAEEPVLPDASTRVPGEPPQARSLPKRPMVLKPRRPPMRGFPPAPEAPPNSRVRSGPTPPDAPDEEHGRA